MAGSVGGLFASSSSSSSMHPRRPFFSSFVATPDDVAFAFAAAVFFPPHARTYRVLVLDTVHYYNPLKCVRPFVRPSELGKSQGVRLASPPPPLFFRMCCRSNQVPFVLRLLNY